MEKNKKTASQLLLDYSDKIQNVIQQNELEDLSENLIMDYITALHEHGFDLETRDPEREVYVFYGYYDKFAKYLDLNGEDSFILLIVNLELDKLNDED